MIGVELSFPGKQLVLDAMEQGLLMNCTHDTVLRFLPPYILERAHVDTTITALDEIFTEHAAAFSGAAASHTAGGHRG
jgi:acetylornithine/succinyldiaminopimelate/putrescine aminotransferase